MKKSNLIISIGIGLISSIIIATSVICPLYVLQKATNKSTKETKLRFDLPPPPSIDAQNQMLTDSFIESNKEVFFNWVKTYIGDKQILPDGTNIIENDISFDPSTGELVIIYEIDKYYYNDMVIEKTEYVKNYISGFKKINIDIVGSDSLLVNTEAPFVAVINNGNDENITNQWYYDWSISPVVNFTTNNTAQLNVAFNNEGSYVITVDVKEKKDSNKTLCLSKKTIQIKSSYDNSNSNNEVFNVSIVDLNKENKIDNESQFSLNFSPKKPTKSVFYEWQTSSQEVINNNGSDNITIVWKNPGLQKLKVIVYDGNNNLSNIICEDEIFVNVTENKNYKYGLELHGQDLYTNKSYSNQPANFNDVISEANKFIKENLKLEDITKYLEQFINQYINNFINARQCKISSNVLEKNINLDSSKKLNGNIKIEFLFNEDMTSNYTSANRIKGDKEIHNFVFENSSINAYINTAVNNFLSFEIDTKYLQKQIISTKNYTANNIGLLNEKIYLDDIDELTLQLNNSFCSIIPEKLINNLYLITSNKSTDDEKNITKEVITKILNKNATLLVTGKSPITGTNISSPLLCINLSKSYTFNSDYVNQLAWTLGSIFNFTGTKSGSIKIIGNKVYISCSAVFRLISADRVIDLNNNGQPLNSSYAEILSNNIYRNLLEIKNSFIDWYNTSINGDWQTFINSLSIRERVLKIYEWLLPKVSYGGMQSANSSSLNGLLEKKVICEGYANLFSYLSNIFQIECLTIIGEVKLNADASGSGGSHAWNLIKDGNQWLWCDPTWDDGMTAGSDKYITEYCMKTTDEFMTKDTHLNVTNWNGGNDLPILVPNYSKFKDS